MNATELFEGISAIPGSKDAGSADGVPESRVVNEIEFARAASTDERKIRASWKRRHGGGAVPLLLITDDPDSESRVQVLGPRLEGPIRKVRAEALLELVRAGAELGKVAAIRRLAEELERLDADGVPGLIVRGLGTTHLFRTRLPTKEERWAGLERLSAGVPTTDWREALEALGYEISRLEKQGFLAKSEGKPGLVVHPHRSATEFARLDESGRLPEGALLAACDANGAPFGMLAAGTRMRLLRAAGDDGGAATRYLELDCASLEPESRPLLGLLAPSYLIGDGFAEVLTEARDYGSGLRERLDRALRERVLPDLGRELGRWAESEGRDLAEDDTRTEIETAALTFVFRALFLLYAESADFLPMNNHTYRQRSFTRIAERAAEELDSADRRSPSLWRDVAALVEAMRTGQTAWNVPPYNGDLFAADGFDGAALLEAATIPDAALGPALVALARDPEDPELGVDFSGLEIGHLGHIYEGLLSLRLTVADRDFRYDVRSDRYVADSDEPDVRRGELFWQTNEGGRKGGGVYYTRSELVRHLVRQSVRPAFETHLEKVREQAGEDPAGAAAKLFDFYVIDPACGSAHFLVEVVDELADQLAALLGEVPLPALREELDSLRMAAHRSYGLRVEDTALLKRLVLKRCVYGIDLSPMGAEIAKVSLWLGSFVPGLSLAYLNHNIQVGNSLIGVARPGAIKPPGDENQVLLFGEALDEAIVRAAEKAVELREIDDRTPEEVEASRAAAEELGDAVGGAERVLNLWTAEALGVKGAQDEALRRGDELIAGAPADLEEQAKDAVEEQQTLHWPLAFAEVFARENPGFDVIVGNPPWEEIKVEELSFYGLYRPGLRSQPERARKEEIELLKNERPDLASLFAGESRRVATLRAYLSPKSGYSGGSGDPDLYRYFCQRYRVLLRDGGRLGVVLPRSAFLNKGSTGFREWLFEEAAPERVDFLLNNRRWAFDTHPQYTVALLSATRRSSYTDTEFEVAGVAKSATEFKSQSERLGLRISRKALGPGREIPLLPNQSAADLLDKLRGGKSFPHGGGCWLAFPIAEFHETHDAPLWKGAKSGWPLWKGESFDQFEPAGVEERLCPPSKTAMKKAHKPRPGTGSLLATVVPVSARKEAVERTVGSARIAYRLVTNRTNSRTIVACLIPGEHFLVNSAPYLAFVEGDRREEAACVGLMNSLTFDWQARRFVEANVNFFILEGLTLPDLDEETLEALATPAARLCCPDERFVEFAEATGVECGPLDAEERTELRVEIDALVARAWGLTADELEIVFEDFTLDAVPEDYREVVRKRFAELN